VPDLRTLTQQFAHAGTLEAIYLRPARDVLAVSVPSAEAIEGRGLIGDRSGDRISAVAGGGTRQVTLIQAEHMPLIAAWSDNPMLDAAMLRRNLVISGLNLIAARSPFPDQTLHLRIGVDVALIVTGDCAPCSKMEAALGHGGYNALRGHGGVTARVVRGGVLKVGDVVRVEVASSQ
jgi:MOSC domain-containing protein YiiM